MTVVGRRSLTLAAGLIAFGFAPGIMAQSAQGSRPRMYDPSTEATVTGTVEEIENVVPPAGGGRSHGGTHLTLKTSTGTLQVHLGPSAFLTEKKLTIAKGDTVEIVGSNVTVDGNKILLARTVKKGQQVVTLRDQSGRPLWSGRP